MGSFSDVTSTSDAAAGADDLEERHRATLEELQQARERWRLILQTANDAYIAIDVDSRVVTWNDRAEEMFGWTAEEAVGRPLTELVIPERFHQAHRRGIEHYRETGEGPVLFERLELPACHRDGRELPIEITIWPSPDGEGERFNAFLRDISERRRVERDTELQERVTVAANATSEVEAALQTAIDEVCRTVGWPVGHAYLLDPEDDGRLVPTGLWHLSDPSFEPFREVTEGTAFLAGNGLPGRVLGSGDPDWIVDVVEDDNFPRFGVAEEVGLHTAMAFPVLSGEHVEAVLEFYSRERTEPDDQMLELMGRIGTQLGRVFERQRSRHALEEANEELREANEMKGRLVSVVSHELRSPLTAIHGFAELLRDDWDETPDDEKLEIVDSIERQSRRLFRLVDDLLTLSRLDTHTVEARAEPVELGPVVESVAADLGLSPQLEIEGPRDAAAMADRDHLVRILVNFLTNARRYGRPPFTVQIRRGAEGSQAHVDLRVCDTGPGVPEEFVPRLFEPFTRAKVTEGEGTGLGLSIVRGLADANEGSAWYEDLDPGASFVVRLPAAEG